MSVFSPPPPSQPSQYYTEKKIDQAPSPLVRFEKKRTGNPHPLPDFLSRGTHDSGASSLLTESEMKSPVETHSTLSSDGKDTSDLNVASATSKVNDTPATTEAEG